VHKDVNSGKKYCLRLLAVRARSVRELDARLKKSGYDERTRHALLDVLKKEGLANDSAFAAEWVDSRLRANPRSRGAIRQELEAKGVSEDVIAKIFMKEAVRLDDAGIARRLVKQKIEKNKGAPDREKVRLYRILMSRGFSAEIAEEIIGEFF
jgi:regulatory protein